MLSILSEDWPSEHKLAQQLHPVVVPPLPKKDEDIGLMEPYKMTAKTRGIGKYICMAFIVSYISGTSSGRYV